MVTKARILIVEDNALIGVLLAEMLESMGYGVCAIEATEADAITAAAKHRPDLMIVDVHLREGSGVSAVAAILREGHIPHVFVTGDMSHGAAFGADAVVIRKPFLEPELADALQRSLKPPA